MESGIDGVALYSGQNRFIGIQVTDTPSQLFVNGEGYKGAPVVLKSTVGRVSGSTEIDFLPSLSAMVCRASFISVCP